MNFRSATILVLAFLLSLVVQAQEKPPLEFDNPKVTNKITNAPLAGVTVTIESNGSVIETKVTGSNGRFKLKPVSLGQKYKITFSLNGYQTRFIEIDLTGIPDAHIPEEGFLLPLDFSLLPTVPEIDYSTLQNKPSGIIKYDKKSEIVDIDMRSFEAYSSEMEKVIQKIKEKEKGAKEADEKFSKLVKEGDAAGGKNDFTTAIAKYTEALNVKKDPEVENKLADVKKKQEEAEKSKGLDKQYQEKITAADAAFKKQDYATAKTLYTEAKTLKPNETLPPQKIAEIDKLITTEMEKEKNYATAINDGNKLFDEKKYDEAIKKYTEAQKIKPNESEPKDLIAKAQSAKSDADKLNQEFNTLVKKGDDAITAKKTDEAISHYTDALKIKQDAAVQAKLDKALSDKKAQDTANKEYNDLITQADKEMGNAAYDKAIELYSKAQPLKPADKYPTDQIAIAKTKKAEAEKNAATEKQYADLMKQGQTDFDAAQYDKAITSFEAAKKVKPAESKPQEMIDLAKQKKQEALDAEKNAVLEKQYADLMKQGQTDFDAAQYDKAITSFEAAKKVKPAESKPQEMIDLANQKKKEAADLEANRKKAKELVAKADAAMPGKKYDEAISLYEEAIGLDAQPEYKTKLDAARKAKSDLENLEKDKLAKEARYKELIAKADAEFAASEWDKAIASYTEALNEKQGEKYPTDQIATAKIKKTEAEKNATLEKQYADLMKQGQTDFDAAQYDKAITSFEAAKKVKPAESKPQEMIDLAKQKKQEALDAEKNAVIEKQYADLMKQGQTDFDAAQYDKAITSFEAAKKVKPAESKPQEMIDLAKQKKQEALDAEAKRNKARELVAKADAVMPQKKYSDAIALYEEAIALDANPEYQKKLDAAKKALADEEQAKQSNAEKETRYKELIAKADAAFAASEWDKAISDYNDALNYKTGEKYPTDQIAKAKAKKAEADLQAETERKYSETMSKADKELNNENFDKAIEFYTLASGIKPNEQLPKDQIALCKQKKAEKDASLASEAEKKQKHKTALEEGVKLQTEGKFDQAIAKYEEALSYVPDDQNTKDLLIKAQKDKEAKEQDKKRMYDDMIKFADKEFNAGNYEDAKGYYERAGNILKNETYPKERAQESQRKLDEKKANDSKRIAYNEALVKADQSFAAAQYEASIPLYEAAQKILPDENYPATQIEKAKAKIQELKDLEANKAQLEQQYKQKIQDADQAFKTARYEEAITLYSEASSLKKDEKYPKDQIEQAKLKLEELKKQEDLAKQEEAYKALIAQADGEFINSNWDEAIRLYTQAKSQKPSDKYPVDQIVKATQKKGEQAANQANAARLEEQKRKYEAKIAEADAAFANEKYEECKVLYTEAAKIKPDESYPQEMIDKANQRLKEISQSEIKKQYDLIIAQADKDFDSGNYTDAKSYYERALKMNANDQHPKNRIEEINKRLAAQMDAAAKRKNYDALIKRADYELAKADYDKAIASYTEAGNIFSEEQYPKDQIAEANRLKAEAASKLAAKEKYRIQMNQGMESYNSGTFDKAIVHFQNALDIIPNDTEAQKMLDKAQKEFDSKKEFYEQQYKAVIAAADEAFNSSKFADAKDLYNRALKFKPSEQYPKDQLEKIREKEKLGTGANNYNKVIAEANKNFNLKNYTKARELYVEAADIQPTIDFPKKRIKEIDAILGGTTNNNNQSNNGISNTVSQTNTTPVIRENVYGNEVNIDIAAAMELIKQASKEAQEDKTAQSREQKDFAEKLQSESAITQDERRMENDLHFTQVEENFDTYGENGEKIRQDNVSGYANLKEQREQNNSTLSGNTNNRLIETSQEFEQIKTDFVYKAVGTDEVRQENIVNTDEFKDARYKNESTLEGNSTEKRISTSEQLTQDNFQLQDQLASKDVLRQENHENLSEFKEARYQNESTLEGNSTEKRISTSEQLTQDNFQLQDQIAENDVIRQENHENLSEFKEARYQNESTLEGNSTEKRISTSEQLTQDNFQLQDQLASKDVLRQENHENLSEFKEARYQNESTLEGNSTEKRISTSEQLTQNNFQLQDQLASKDVLRQENHENLSEFKEARYQNESTLEGNSTEKRISTSEQLTQDNFQLQDQLASKDVLRQENHENLSELKENRYKNESTLEGNANEKTLAVKDSLNAELIRREQRASELNQNSVQNYEKLKEDTDYYRLKNEEMASQGDVTREKNQAELEGKKYTNPDPHAGLTPTLVSEKSFQKNDANGKPTEITIQRMVRKGNVVYEYLMVINKNGNSYFKNNSPISETQWSTETSVPKE